MALSVDLIPAWQDNYIYAFTCPQTGTRAVVDPGQAEPFLDYLGDRPLDTILITHKHWDHVTGLAEVKAATGAHVIGPAKESHAIGDIDQTVKEGDTVQVGNLIFNVIETPGHTLGHVVYYCENENVLFSGDTLFHLGCGRLFEGSAAQMWDSLSKIKALPDATSVYCGHEYAQANIKFCTKLDPKNTLLQKRGEEIIALRQQNKPTNPFNLGLEKKINPFLRPESVEIAQHVCLLESSPWEVFRAVRKLRDEF